MPISSCPTCNGPVSTEAAACPTCGHPGPFQAATQTAPNPLRAILLGVGGGLALILVAAAVVIAAYWPDEPAQPSPLPSAARPTPGSRPTDARADAVRFLQAIEAASKEADRVCFEAKQCGYVERDGTNGQVPTTAAVAGCLAERRPKCQAAVQRLREAPAPAGIKTEWVAWVDAMHRSTFEELEVLDQVLSSTQLPHVLRARGETFEGVIDWGNAKGVKEATAYFARDFELETRSRQQADAGLIAKLQGVCREGVTCTARKVMHGAPAMVEAPFMRRGNAPAQPASSITPAHEEVVEYLRSDKEPKVKDAAWTAPNILKVGVVDDGTRRDGYAEYVCLELADRPLPKPFLVSIIDIQKLVAAEEWVELGKALCN